jgi:hypothetical protein
MPHRVRKLVSLNISMWSINMGCKISRNLLLLLYNTMFTAQTATTVWYSKACFSWTSLYMGQVYTQGFCLCVKHVNLSRAWLHRQVKPGPNAAYLLITMGEGNVMAQWLTVCRSMAKAYIQRLINIMAFHNPSRKVLKYNFKYICHNTFLLDSSLTVIFPFSGIKSLV